MSARDKITSDVPETLPKPHVIPLQRAPIDDEPPLPAHLQGNYGDHQDLGSEVSWEWDPLNPFEELEGTLVSKTPMRLGGMAYTLLVEKLVDGEEVSSLLLKKGGRILDTCMTSVEPGDRIFLRYLGLLPPKPGLHAARNWRAIRINNP